MSDGNYYDERERQDELDREAMLERLRQGRGPMKTSPEDPRFRNMREPVDGIDPVQPELVEPAPQTGGQTNETPIPPQQKYDVKLGGFDMSKLGDAEHYKTHPKYAVARLLNSGNYGYDTDSMGRMLKDLQADPNTKHMFEGWEAHRDGIRHNGQGPRYEAWGDTDFVDLMASWDGKNAAKDFWWGANDNNPANDPKQPGLMRAQMPGVGFGPSSFQSIQQLAPTDTDFFNTLQAQLQDILGPASFDRDALLQLLGRK